MKTLVKGKVCEVFMEVVPTTAITPIRAATTGTERKQDPVDISINKSFCKRNKCIKLNKRINAMDINTRRILVNVRSGELQSIMLNVCTVLIAMSRTSFCCRKVQVLLVIEHSRHHQLVYVPVYTQSTNFTWAIHIIVKTCAKKEERREQHLINKSRQRRGELSF